MRIQRLLILLTIITTPVVLSAQEGYPVPTKGEHFLFYIQHSDNTNTYMYEANYKDGKLDEEDPIKSYRILFEDHAKIAKLTDIQKTFAYGMHTKKVQDNLYDLHLSASKKQHFYLIKDDAGKDRVTITINGKTMYLDHMFVQVKEGTSGIGTKVSFVQFLGNSVDDGTAVGEKLYF